jgi:hypothetical protein
MHCHGGAASLHIPKDDVYGRERFLQIVETISVHGLVDICLFYGEQHTGYQQTL